MYQGLSANNDEGMAPIPQSIYEISSTSKGRIGIVRRVDLRTFVYSKAGALALGIGLIAVQPTPAANHQNVAVAAAVAVGANQVTVTLGATLASLNQYEDGYLVISDATGEGTIYRIRSNPAAASGASLTVTLYDDVHTILTTSSECCLIPNPYNGLVISVVDQADIPVGVPLVAVTAAYYAWIQTGGPAPVWADENVVQGADLTLGDSVAGSVKIATAGKPVLGRAIIALVDTEYRPVYLTIKE